MTPLSALGLINIKSISLSFFLSLSLFLSLFFLSFFFLVSDLIVKSLTLKRSLILLKFFHHCHPPFHCQSLAPSTETTHHPHQPLMHPTATTHRCNPPWWVASVQWWLAVVGGSSGCQRWLATMGGDGWQKPKYKSIFFIFFTFPLK